MRRNRFRASQLTLLFVLIIIGGSFLWWARHRPSYLLYQANQESLHGNEAALVSRYQNLLNSKNLSKEDEIRLRLSLGDVYLRSFQNTNGTMLFHAEPNSTARSFEDFDATKPSSSQTKRVESPYMEMAKKQFDRVLVLNPKEGKAHYGLGRILWFRKLESYALQELELSRQYDPTNPDPLWFLGQINLDRDNATAAREFALQAVAIAPAFDRARGVLINAYSALGDYDNVERQYSLLSSEFKADPINMATYAFFLTRQNRWSEAVPLMDQALKAAPNDGWIRILFGRMLLEFEKPEEASGAFNQAGSLLPENLWPRVYQVEATSKRGLCEEALKISEPLTDPEYPNGLSDWSWTYVMMAWQQLCSAKTSRALTSLDQALRLAPDLYEATQEKSRLLMDEGRYDELGFLIKKLLGEKIHESDAYSLLAESFYQQHKWELIQEMSDAAIKKNRGDANAYTMLGLVQAYHKDKIEATYAFNMAMKLRPFDKEIQGYEAFASGVYFTESSAEQKLQGALNENRRSPLLWFLWGEFQRIQNNLPEAEVAYQNALAIKPYYLKAQLGLISCLYNKGMKDQADLALGSALQINSKNPDVLAWRAKIRGSR